MAEGFAELADLPEPQRIEIIARTAALGKVVGFIVEDDEKADRYIAALTLQKRWRVRVVDRMPGPVKGTVMVRVGPAES